MLILGQEITIFAPKARKKTVLTTLKAAICTKSVFFASKRPNEVDRATFCHEFWPDMLLYPLLKIY
jgi:hypothetical protein